MSHDPTDVHRSASHLARNIRALREARGLSQAQLAKLSGIPRPTWANLESGAANPTLAVLLKVSATLQVSLEELVGPPRTAARLYGKGELRTRRRGRVEIRDLLPDPMQGLQMERMELPPGGAMTGIPHTAGTREYLCCERGTIRLTASGESWAGLGTKGQLPLGAFLERPDEGLYLHDWSLPRNAPEALLDELRTPRWLRGDLLRRCGDDVPYAGAWPSLFVGAPGTRSTCHVDSGSLHFAMALVHGGAKKWRVWRREDAAFLFPRFAVSADDVLFDAARAGAARQRVLLVEFAFRLPAGRGRSVATAARVGVHRGCT